MKIMIFGHVCVDKNSSEHASYVSAGGSAIFMNKIFTQFPDCEVSVVAPYGHDFLPYLSGVNILPSEPLSGKTLVYENISKNGHRVQKAHERDGASGLPLSEEILAKVHEADIIFYAPLLPTFSVEYLSILHKYSKKSAFKVLLPQGYFRDFEHDDTVVQREFDEVRDILEHVDLVVVSEQDHENILGEVEHWVGMHPVTGVVTLGERGALVVTKAGKMHVLTRPVKESAIVDSVGSGDIFSAGFAYKYVLTHNLEKAAKFANELARQCLFYSSDQIKIDFTKLK